MGYTHYYTLHRAEDLKMDEIGQDIAALISNTDVPIVDGWGEPGTEPLITLGPY